MPSIFRLSTAGLILLSAFQQSVQAMGLRRGQENIVVIMTDDQDARLGSLDVQTYIQRELIAKGLSLTNHFATVAQCCPSRTSWLRGQAAHNTNLTLVTPPGGGYDKFVATGQDEDYLPHWLKAAGYTTEYIGKLMNGYSLATYSPKPKGWDYTDILVGPYTYEFNNVVMSENGERPVYYHGYHQTDIIRAKALDRLQRLIEKDEPYYIQIAPTAPHQQSDGPAVPCVRHMWTHLDARAPRIPNFNPKDEFQNQKPSWLRDTPLLNQSVLEFTDWQYLSRIQSLVGIDEMVEDVVELLREKGQLDNTYIIYTTDNGFHIGNHRQVGGKGLPYIEDVNIPMIIRGPGIPINVSSTIPSTHVDMAPTFLDIASVPERKYPPFFDGRSLLPEWKAAGNLSSKASSGKEIINIEFWGRVNNAGAPDYMIPSPIYAYKTLRIVGEQSSWLYSRWCDGNATELYNTIDDPYELTNLALSPAPEHEKLMARLNGLLLVTKSCSQESCRNPWTVLQADYESSTSAGKMFTNLEEALDTRYDDFFRNLPPVGFQKCMNYLFTPNEGPFYPPESISLGSEYRRPTDNFPAFATNSTFTPGNGAREGTAAQRHATLAEILKRSRSLTDAEMGTSIICGPPDYCGNVYITGIRVE
ncbi:related to sulfatases [Cephalotrichum gorgonifer]|uniref:Related to sulfatases n=1 Tax=Cephalotrichum gorgonifer TaxID=2041049 RepID=A0AAE8N853_9PEZI|nr:related to sulfatases [Cephalotrichum gorgonifer]